MSAAALDDMPGFRRRVRITPAQQAVCAQLEDDYHCMSVTLEHDGQRVTNVLPTMHRAPWTTCPGAEQQLQDSFSGLTLVACAAQNAIKRQNCTHLFDLAVLAASHAGEASATEYDILVSDAVAGVRTAEIRRDGQALLSWQEQGFFVVSPAELAGTRIDQLKDWINAQADGLREAARLLQWGNMLANGRAIPLAQQSDASKMPPGCYTFQPERAQHARRVGEILDFSSTQERQPLALVEPAI